MKLNLNGRVAVVTGAAQGIGLETSRQLALAGATVILADRHSASDRAIEIEAEGGHATAVTMDVSDEASVASAFERIRGAFGAPHILVSNAGISLPSSTLQTSLSTWRQVLDVNLTGAFLCAREVLPGMADAAWGRIVVMSSLNAKSAPVNGDNASYAASKAGLSGLIRNLAVEFGPAGVTVNGVAPGVVDTDLLRGAHDEASRRRLLSRIPVGHFATPLDIAALTTFLCSDFAGSITGEIVNVNGGLYFD